MGGAEREQQEAGFVDAAMEPIVSDLTATWNHLTVENLEPETTYYWTVEAVVDRSRSNRGVRLAQGEPWRVVIGGND